MSAARKRLLVLFLAIAVWLAASADVPSDGAFEADVKLPVLELKDTRLPNGLRVILVPDHSAPVYAINVTYNVGSRNERPGHTGFAHLFEHMMFEGSQNVGKGEHFILVLNNGGGMNGTTNEDRTNYFEELPKNQLDLGLYLEADRMRSLNITQANFENQRKTVEEERRQSIDNQPYGRADLDIDSLSYDNFAYKHSDDRLDGRPQRRDRSGRRGLFPHLLRAEQRRSHAGRRFRSGRSPGQGQKIFRIDSRADSRRRRWI